MADRYWVGGAGTWDATTTTNWSATSGGGGGASAPTSVDNVIFDSASSGASYVVTVSGTQSCNNLTINQPATGTINFTGAFNLNISGSAFAGATITQFSANGDFRFVGANTGRTWNWVGFGAPAIVFTFQHTGDITLASNIGNGGNRNFAFTSGTFNAVTFNVSSANNGFSISGSAVVNMGSGTWNCNSSNPSAWTATTPATINPQTSTISMNSASTFSTAGFNGGGYTYNNVSFVNGTVSTGALLCAISGANTFNNLTITAPTGAGIKNFSFGANQVVTGTFTVGGATATNRVSIQSNVFGTPRAITAANVSLQNVDFTDITGAGAAAPFTGTNLGNAANNSNITFTTKTVYWNLAGAQNWSSTGWATSSGGTPAVGNFPLAQDTAVFDNTGSVTGTITVNTIWNIGTLDMSARTSAMTISLSNSPTMHGLIAARTSGSLVTINSSSVGTQRTITYRNSGTISTDYMSFRDINFSYTLNASNPYRVYAGVNSTNGGNNNGIAFINGTTKKAYLLTTGTSWTVPADWNSGNNNIYLLGAGGGGATSVASGNNRAAGGGGGGGGYTALTNQTLTPSAVIPYTIGTSGSNTSGGNTTFGGTAGSTLFNGTNQNLTVVNRFGNATTTTPFTWECWVYPTVQLNGTGIFCGSFPSGGSIPFALYGASFSGGASGSNLNFGYYNGVSWFGAQSSTSLTLNTWSHIAAVYNGTVLTLYLNGNSIATATIAWTTNLGVDPAFYIGRRWDTFGSYFFTGNISNLRYVSGTAVYTSNFTPPTSPLTAITNTQLLTAQSTSSPTVDASVNAFTITNTGATVQTGFSPFTTGSYIASGGRLSPTTNSPASLGGLGGLASTDNYSGIFNGTSSLLSLADNAQYTFGTSDFTIEAYIYYGGVNAGSQAQILTKQAPAPLRAIQFRLLSGNTLEFVFTKNAGTLITFATTSTVPTNQWAHVAVVRNGLTLTLYINGVSSATNTLTAGDVIDSPAASVILGGYNVSAPFVYTNAYISNFRWVIGTAVYTSNFTPSTSPLTNITNTKLLTLQSSSFVDNSSNAFPITNSGAIVSQASPFPAVGFTSYSGGTGGAGASGTVALTGYGSGGGGGAGGPNGVGGNGGNGFGSTTAASIAGGGGGGNGGGTAGGNASSATGGLGGNNFSGVGGGATNGAAGTVGGGGAGNVSASQGGQGGSGIDIQNTLGGAGGKGGQPSGTANANTGNYGGGGAGGGINTGGTTSSGGAGSQGVIFIVYEPGGGTNVTVNLTGVSGTTALGTVSVTTTGSVSVTVDLTGVVGTTALGTATVTTISNVTVSLTGLQATTFLGTATVSAAANIYPTGPPATGFIGDVTVFVTASVTVSLTGVVGTTALGTTIVIGDANISVSGVQGNTDLGTVSLITNNFISVTGLVGTTQLGTAVAFTNVDISVTGVQGTTSLGSVTATGSADITLTGVQGTTALGTISLITNNFISVTGLQATGQIGTASVTGEANVYLTGVQGDTVLGIISLITNNFISVSGVQATFILNLVNVWGDIVPVPTNPWSPVDDSQTENWVIIDKAAG